MLVKLFGSIIISLVGVFSAWELVRYHKMKLRVLDGIISLIFYIKGQVDCYARPIGDILSTVPPRIAADCNCPMGISSLEDVIERGEMYLDEECVRIFESFAAEFGSSFREEQVRRCDHYISLLTERRVSVELKTRADGRSGGAIVLCAAVCLAILLW